MNDDAMTDPEAEAGLLLLTGSAINDATGLTIHGIQLLTGSAD
jgi:hypothetical protein